MFYKSRQLIKDHYNKYHRIPDNNLNTPPNNWITTSNAKQQPKTKPYSFTTTVKRNNTSTWNKLKQPDSKLEGARTAKTKSWNMNKNGCGCIATGKHTCLLDIHLHLLSSNMQRFQWCYITNIKTLVIISLLEWWRYISGRREQTVTMSVILFMSSDLAFQNMCGCRIESLAMHNVIWL